MSQRLAAIAAALALLALACGGGTATGGAGPALPDASLPVLDGEGELHTADLVGQPAVINFWATWCPFCVDEMPDFEEVHQEVAGQVRFVGVDREDVASEALELARRTGVTYTLVEDRNGSFFRAVQGRGMPTTLFVDADGVVVHSFAGPLTREQLRTLIRTHLGV